MKLNDVIPYIENINDIDVAKSIIELKSDPEGYYKKIYKEVCEGMDNNISEKELEKIFSDYEKNSAIKHFQYMMKLQDEIKESKLQSLLHKKAFISVIDSISDIYILRLYLTKLNEQIKDQDIDYMKYVPEYKVLYK